MVGARLRPGERHGRLGQVLRLAREKRGVTLAQASVDLHIPQRQLEALEAGDICTFQAEVYARGAYMRYARYLEIEAAVDGQALTRAISRAREIVPLRVPVPRVWWERFLTPRWIFSTLLAGAALVGGSYVGWQVQSFLRVPMLTLNEPATAVVSSKKVVVQGSAEQEAMVTVNDSPVLLDAKGAFTAELLLHPGVNVVEVKATNTAGRSNVVRRDLLLPRT